MGVCFRHFSEEMYISQCQRRQLHKTAYPIINIPEITTSNVPEIPSSNNYSPSSVCSRNPDINISEITTSNTSKIPSKINISITENVNPENQFALNMQSNAINSSEILEKPKTIFKTRTVCKVSDLTEREKLYYLKWTEMKRKCQSKDRTIKVLKRKNEKLETKHNKLNEEEFLKDLNETQKQFFLMISKNVKRSPKVCIIIFFIIIRIITFFASCENEYFRV